MIYEICNFLTYGIAVIITSPTMLALFGAWMITCIIVGEGGNEE